MSDYGPRKPLIPPPGSGAIHRTTRGRNVQPGDPGTPPMRNLDAATGPAPIQQLKPLDPDHSASVAQAIKSHGSQDPHPSTSAPSVPATPPSRKMTGGPGGDIA